MVNHPEERSEEVLRLFTADRLSVPETLNKINSSGICPLFLWVWLMAGCSQFSSSGIYFEIFG